jgi:hypothetical protein
MWLLALLLILLFFGLGFAAKILWWGIIIGVILLIASAFSGTRL